MVKVKFNTTILDRDSGETHYPSDEFVEISEAFAKRIKEIQSEDVRHKDSFEFEKKSPVVSEKQVKKK